MKFRPGAQKSPSWCQYSANRWNDTAVGTDVAHARDAGQAEFLIGESQPLGEDDDLAPSGREVLQFTRAHGLAADADHTVTGKSLEQEVNVMIRQIGNSPVELDANAQPPALVQCGL